MVILNFQSKNSPNLLIKERMAALSLRKHQWDKWPLQKNAAILEERSSILWIIWPDGQCLASDSFSEVRAEALFVVREFPYNHFLF